MEFFLTSKEILKYLLYFCYCIKIDRIIIISLTEVECLSFRRA